MTDDVAIDGLSCRLLEHPRVALGKSGWRTRALLWLSLAATTRRSSRSACRRDVPSGRHRWFAASRSRAPWRGEQL